MDAENAELLNESRRVVADAKCALEKARRGLDAANAAYAEAVEMLRRANKVRGIS